MDIDRLTRMIEIKGARIVKYQRNDLSYFASVLENEDIREYLMECQTKESYDASGVFLGGDLEDQIMSNDGCAPGAYIFKYGFVVIGGSAGGNGICVDGKTGKVYFADHEGFVDDKVGFFEAPRKWKTVLGLNYENILLALTPIADSLEEFLLKAFNDELTDFLEGLD